jgi:Phage integrase, N-terminal SAM-like domain
MEGGGMDPVLIEHLGRTHPLARHLDDFLTDLANAGSSTHTRRAYRGDLLKFAAHHDGEIGDLDTVVVRAYLTDVADLAASTRKRKRKRAAVASFCRWAVRHDLLLASPMDKIDTIKVPKTLPRPAVGAGGRYLAERGVHVDQPGAPFKTCRQGEPGQQRSRADSRMRRSAASAGMIRLIPKLMARGSIPVTKARLSRRVGCVLGYVRLRG